MVDIVTSLCDTVLHKLVSQQSIFKPKLLEPHNIAKSSSSLKNSDSLYSQPLKVIFGYE